MSKRGNAILRRKTELARKYDAIATKDAAMRRDAGMCTSFMCESALSTMRVGTMFVMQGNPMRDRERRLYEVRKIEDKVATGLKVTSAILRIYPMVLIKTPEVAMKRSGVNQREFNQLVEWYKEQNWV